MAIQAVIFDLDGTITRFNLDYKKVRAEVRDLLVKSGVPLSLLPIDESTFGMLRRSEIHLRTCGRCEMEIKATVSRALALIEKCEVEAAKTTDLLPGVRQALRVVKKEGIKIGLFTVNGDVSTEYILNKFAIRKLFDAVVSRNKVSNVKPNKEHLQSALDLLHASTNEAAVVGDGTSDMKCAKALDMLAIGLLTGVSTLDNLISAGADYVITEMTDLPELIAELNSCLPKENIF